MVVMANQPQISVKIDRDVWERLRFLADSTGMRINWMVSQAAKDYLQKWGKGQAGR
jgi:predicted transcriptional regulator